MYEKVNPMHPDKVADRIAGAIVDLAYKKVSDPKLACEVLIGHGQCDIILESSVEFKEDEIKAIIDRISKTNNIILRLKQQKQDVILASNQEILSCGDNGIFKGSPTTSEQKKLSAISRTIYDRYGSDGKYILVEDKNILIICQSNTNDNFLNENFTEYKTTINPLGNWTGGLDVDTGATNRKLGSDMGDAVTGGGIHGKDLSKADVSINIYCHLLANQKNAVVTAFCAIGDRTVNVDIYNPDEYVLDNHKPREVLTVKYEEIVNTAKEYIEKLGGYEKMAEWGLI